MRDVRIGKTADPHFRAKPVEIVVGTGTDQVSYFVHDQQLRQHSAFFATAMEDGSGLMEGEVRKVELPKDEAVVFGDYVHWLCNSTIFYIRGAEGPDWQPLIKLYILAQKLLDGHCQDGIIDALIQSSCEVGSDGSNWYPFTMNVDLVHKHTSVGSPLRRLMVGNRVYLGRATRIDTITPHNNNLDFAVDLLTAFLTKRERSGDDWKIEGHCGGLETGIYHAHGKDEPCSGEVTVVGGYVVGGGGSLE
ncbi:hypothetical protein BAUCODRAFT_21198 [Baudoinia panamericana UAMH 10762]|uniref:BTB domain-containing protein n=1 Tax=Baudoinia panamericana (strain UAMH 10762) TaxID=717646 RepID=M2M2D9_BAUPA|nr:uncharacterized protein BAUCODRAFT_21198 [Baudoinia panamericana UAMH 10762]EMD01278.1 hypothetical protein BAUCODRAFT_21198 [Baudoinia panamericana UAMH 10762]